MPSTAGLVSLECTMMEHSWEGCKMEALSYYLEFVKNNWVQEGKEVLSSFTAVRS